METAEGRVQLLEGKLNRMKGLLMTANQHLTEQRKNMEMQQQEHMSLKQKLHSQEQLIQELLVDQTARSGKLRATQV